MRTARRERASLVLLFIFICLAGMAHADDSNLILPEKVMNTKRLMLIARTGFSFVTHNGSQTGWDGAIGLSYALNTKYALMGMARQSLAVSGFSNLYTEVGAGALYALRGSLLRPASATRLGGRDVVQAESSVPASWYLSVLAKQYLFNGSATVVPLTGLSIGLIYHRATVGGFDVEYGGELDYISNGAISLTPIRAFVSIALWP